MKNIEQFIRNNNEAFKDADPLQHHLNRFAEKLMFEHKKSHYNVIAFYKVAIVILLVITAGIIGYQIRKSQYPNIELSSLSKEYQEVELYYTSNINSQMRIIRRLGRFDNNKHQQMLLKELKEMDKKYQQLRKELKLYPNDERIIDAMIEYYQVKTNILNQIIEQLYQVKEQTTKNVGVAA